MTATTEMAPLQVRPGNKGHSDLQSDSPNTIVVVVTSETEDDFLIH